MELSFSKVGTSIFITVAGLAFLIFGFVGNQNSWFLMAAGAIFIGGIVAGLGGLNMFTKSVRSRVIAVLIVFGVVLSALNFKSIKEPIEFRTQKVERNDKVIQQLKDIRQAQIGFKSARNVYASDFETLISFLKNDSITVIKAVGFVPDSLTEEQAIEKGIVSRDTIYEPALGSVFSKFYTKDRDERYSLNIDSLKYIPFSGGEIFDIQAGQIQRNNLLVQVFEITAPREKVLVGLNKRMIKMDKDLRVGSMINPTTSGNWGE